MSTGSHSAQSHNVARKAKGGYTRQRRGCLTCRQRKKKCDQASPLCGHCLRLNLVCKREPPRELPQPDMWGEDHVEATRALALPRAAATSTSRRSGKEIDEPPRPSICEPLDFFIPTVFSGKEPSTNRRSMMRYYTSTLANMLSATWENNCFLSVILPMAFDCPLLLDVVSAMSSAHLAVHHPEFQVSSLQHRGQVLANISAAMQSNGLSDDMCLAVAMTMCSSETITDATSSSWAHHLAGAAAVLQPKVATGEALDPTRAETGWLSSFEGKWLLRNFAYHDALMSVSLDRRPLLTGDYWASADDTMADPYSAFASRIIFLISEISILNADWEEQWQSCDALGDGSLLERAQGIAAQLRDWECPQAQSSDAPLTVLSETYRSAAFIYLGRVIRKRCPADADKVLPEGITPYVASICEGAVKIPQGSNEECSLLFPLFIAGGEAEIGPHRHAIRNRMHSMNIWRKFRNVDACIEVLDEVWSQDPQRMQGNRAARLDWRDIVEQRGWQLALS